MSSAPEKVIADLKILQLNRTYCSLRLLFTEVDDILGVLFYQQIIAAVHFSLVKLASNQCFV